MCLEHRASAIDEGARQFICGDASKLDRARKIIYVHRGGEASKTKKNIRLIYRARIGINMFFCQEIS